jgi:hypothetical protein
MTAADIRMRQEQLFLWTEAAFRQRCADPLAYGDPMEAACLMEMILDSLTRWEVGK